jgi:hypothetical protein|tara:strand:- start:10483 stop:10836 length:354 start_codon:yes stop_codon:yes gene_type:complete
MGGPSHTSGGLPGFIQPHPGQVTPVSTTDLFAQQNANNGLGNMTATQARMMQQNAHSQIEALRQNAEAEFQAAYEEFRANEISREDMIHRISELEDEVAGLEEQLETALNTEYIVRA